MRWGRMLAVVAAVGGVGIPAHAQKPPPLEHLTLTVGGHPLAVWARRPEHPRGAILFVHGSTWSARPDFDLQVPGEPRSVLAAFAAHGYASYAVDLRGYGATPPDPSGWDTPNQAAADVSAAVVWVWRQDPSLGTPVLFGWSLGATVAQLVAQDWPDRLAALVLIGYWFNPDTTIARDTVTGPPPKVRNTAAAAASDFITPGAIDAQVKDAYVQQALAADPYTVQWRDLDQFNALDPSRVRVPTLLFQGQLDPNAPTVNQARFFSRLATPNREWITIPGADHAALLENTQGEIVDATLNFLSRLRH